MSRLQNGTKFTNYQMFFQIFSNVFVFCFRVSFLVNVVSPGQCSPLLADQLYLPLPTNGLSKAFGTGRSALRVVAGAATVTCTSGALPEGGAAAPLAYDPHSWGKHS